MTDMSVQVDLVVKDPRGFLLDLNSIPQVISRYTRGLLTPERADKKLPRSFDLGSRP